MISALLSYWTRLDQYSDKRTRGWLLVDSPIAVMLVVMSYLLMVWWGPKLMRGRKPFKINGLLIGYNFCLVLLNAMIVKEILLGTSRLGHQYLCQRNIEDYHPDQLRILRALWWFYLSKILDFTDTLFFILRKKNDQMSFLHVYHHSSIFPIVWVGIKWVPGGAGIRLSALNSFVHFVMYSYYCLSSMGSSFKKYLWWKKYITKLQLVQFVLSLSWSVHSLLKGSSCNHPAIFDWINITSMCTFLVLFGKFYRQKYTKKVK